jgi:hypothetical protein
MKITKISLQGFRAFDERFELDLDGGRSLLLHGENGSGKSSIYFALKRFFEERGDSASSHRNCFSPNTRRTEVRVEFCVKDLSGTMRQQSISWNSHDGHPLLIPTDSVAALKSRTLRAGLVDAARRAGFLDYRVLLRTHYRSDPQSRFAWQARRNLGIYGGAIKDLEAQLFDLFASVVLGGVRVTSAGGTETTIGELMRKVWETAPSTRHRTRLQYANSCAKAFSSSFNAILPQLESQTSEFLNYFENHQLSIKFKPVSLAWSREHLELEGASLVPEITFRGKHIVDHHHFLNEARLSALATCLFLAGVRLSDNDYTNPAHPRFLVLDDSLIGLELQNRLPILRILTGDAFKNYQILLLTHDRVWFDLARGHLREKDGWLHRELLADDETGHLIPRLRSSQGDLERAREHLANGDLKAAAVYARSAFEWKLRCVAEKHGIKVVFKPDADTIPAGVLWDGILVRQREREAQRQKGTQTPDFVTSLLEKEVETMRSTVLNKLSHTGASSLVPAEVASAIATVEAVFRHGFPRAP